MQFLCPTRKHILIVIRLEKGAILIAENPVQMFPPTPTVLAREYEILLTSRLRMLKSSIHGVRTFVYKLTIIIFTSWTSITRDSGSYIEYRRYASPTTNTGIIPAPVQAALLMAPDINDAIAAAAFVIFP